MLNWSQEGKERGAGKRERKVGDAPGENIYEYEKRRMNPNSLLVLIGVLVGKPCQIYSAK